MECSASKIISNEAYYLLFILLVHNARNKEIGGKGEEKKKANEESGNCGSTRSNKSSFLFYPSPTAHSTSMQRHSKK